MADDDVPDTPQQALFWTGFLLFALIAAFFYVMYVSRPHTPAGDPSGSWVGLVTVKFPEDGALEAAPAKGVGNAVLHYKLRHSWMPGNTEYFGHADLCDGGGNKRDFDTYFGSFRDPRQFVTSVATNAPLGGNMWGHYSKTELTVVNMSEYQFNMRGTLERGDEALYARECASLKAHEDASPRDPVPGK